MNNLSRRLHWLGLAAVALGGANLTILVLDNLINTYGTIAVPLLIFGLILSIFASFGYAELVLMYPHKIGGISAVCGDAYRPYNPLLANLAGTCYWFAWTVLISFAAVFLSNVVQSYFSSISINMLSSILIILTMLLAFNGMQWVHRLAIPIALLAATSAIFVILLPLFTGKMQWEQMFQYNIFSSFEGKFGQFSSVMAALYLIGWVAPAFENVFCYVGETKNPEKNILTALYISIGLAIIFYVLFPLIWLAIFNEKTFIKNLVDKELIYVVSPFLGQLSNAFVTWLIIFNMILCMIAPMTGPPRTLYQLSADGLLPKIFGILSNQNVPIVPTLLTTLTALLIVWLGAPLWLLAASNFGYVTAIVLASIAVWILRRDAPNVKRLYRAPKGFITLGLFIAFIWILTIIFGFHQFGIKTMLIGICFSFIGVFFYLWRKVEDKIQQAQPILQSTLHFKLIVPTLAVMSLTALAFIVAISNISPDKKDLIALLLDIFVIIAIMTLAIGIILPGIVIHAVDEINLAAKRLINGPLYELSKSLQALALNDLENIQIHSVISLIHNNSQDELGQMTSCFNQMQIEIQKSIDNLDITCRRLVTTKRKYIQSNLALHEEISKTKQALMTEMNKRIHNEVFEKSSSISAEKISTLKKHIFYLSSLINATCVKLENQLSFGKEDVKTIVNELKDIAEHIENINKLFKDK